MEAFAQAPDPLTNTKPMDKTWKLWRESFLIFLRVAGFDKKENDIKADFLKNKIGKFGQEEIIKIEHELEGEISDFDTLLQKLDDHFNPPKIEAQERYKFWNSKKKNNESIESFINDLKEKAKTCNFGNLTESLIRDKVILDIKDENFRKIIFQDKELNLNKLILHYKHYEINTEKIKDVAKKVNSENVGTKSKNSNINNTPKTNAAAENKNPQHTCWRCATTHPPKMCPAFNEVCAKCNGKGHFTFRCKNSGSKSNNLVSNQTVSKIITLLYIQKIFFIFYFN